MPIRLTETAIKKAIRDAADGTRRELADLGCPGLRLRLTPSGAARWVLACRDRLGRMRRFSLAPYPGMGISEARSEARALHTRVKREGADPIADRRRDLAIGAAARAGFGTLAAVVEIYGAYQGKTLKSWPHSRKRIDLVFKSLLPRAIADLRVADLQMAADAYRATQSAAFAVRTLRPVLKWAARRGHVPSALANLHSPVPVRRRRRVLDRDELAALLPILRAGTDAYAAARRFIALTGHRDVPRLHWRQIDLSSGTMKCRTRLADSASVHTVSLSDAAIALLLGLPSGAPGDAVFPLARAHPAVLRFILLTLARREEAAGACWREIDLIARTWTVPDERTKNAELHTVPLSRQAIALLRALGQGAPDELVFSTPSGGAIGNWDRVTKSLQSASGTSGWTRHDLRRTGATLLGELGELPDIIEAALNHVSIRSSLAATYNRSRYRPQVAAALQRLADELDRIETSASKVALMSHLLLE
jgi:integrase